MTDKKPKFLRRVWQRYSKLGKGRKKIQKWRRPTGRDNKMREKRKGVPVVVSIGYKQGEKVRGLLKEKKKVLIMNVKDLEKVGRGIAVIGKVGLKKKMEIAKKAKQMKIEIYNMNAKKFLKEAEMQRKKKQESKKKEESEKVKTKKEQKKEKADLKKRTKVQATKLPTSSAGVDSKIPSHSPKLSQMKASSNERKKSETKSEIIEDIEESGVSEKIAKAEEALDEKEQIMEDKE